MKKREIVDLLTSLYATCGAEEVVYTLRNASLFPSDDKIAREWLATYGEGTWQRQVLAAAEM